MTMALLIKTSGELYRLADTSVWAMGGIKDGIPVGCYNALVFTRNKRRYDRIVIFTFDSGKHKIVEAGPDKVLQEELRRAKELVCHKFHSSKCQTPPFDENGKTRVYKSVVKEDPDWAQKELVRLAHLCREYILSPGKFDRTKISVLLFDLTNALDSLEKGTEHAQKGERPGPVH